MHLMIFVFIVVGVRSEATEWGYLWTIKTLSTDMEVYLSLRKGGKIVSKYILGPTAQQFHFNILSTLFVALCCKVDEHGPKFPSLA